MPIKLKKRNLITPKVKTLDCYRRSGISRKADLKLPEVGINFKHKTMSDFNFTGRTLVKNLQKQFKKEFGGTLRVYNGKRFADPDVSLASIRKGGKSKKVDFKVKGNMHVGTFENKMLDEFGIRVQVANKDNSKLVDDKVTLSKCGDE